MSITRDKESNILTDLLQNRVGDNAVCSLSESISLVTFTFQKYYTEYQEHLIESFAKLNMDLARVLNKEMYSPLDRYDLEIINTASGVIRKYVIFRRVVELTNNIKIPFRTLSKISQLLRGIALKQDYCEKYISSDLDIMVEITKDVKKDFTQQFEIYINGTLEWVYGMQLSDYLKEKGINIEESENGIIDDLFLFRPANEYAVGSAILKKTLLSVAYENEFISNLKDYYRVIGDEVKKAQDKFGEMGSVLSDMA